MDGFKIFNSGGYNTNFISIFDNTSVTLSNFEIDHFESKTTKELVNYESDVNYYDEEGLPSNIINNIKVSNIISRGVFLRNKNGNFDIYNAELRNIHECYKYNNCTSMNNDRQHVDDAELVVCCYGYRHPRATFYSLNIDQMYGDIGILIYTAKANVYNSTVTNSYFKNGFVHIDENMNEGGGLIVSNSTFENNTSECGTIFNFPYHHPGSDKFIKINNSTFINNTASKFGGVVYSMGEHNPNRMIFTNNSFYNNHAKFGNVLYTHSKAALLDVGEYLNSSDISTPPAYFQMYGNLVEEISILSSGSIPEDIMCKLN